MEITKSELKLINALETSHGRKKNNAFLVEGPKMVDELLNAPFKTKLVAATEEWIQNNPKHLSLPGLRLISPNELQKYSQFSSANQVLAVAEFPEPGPFNAHPTEFILVLDTIQDPGNLGTIIRTADWFGISKILCSNETADAFNPKVVQASMGSVFRVSIYYENLETIFKEFAGKVHIYGSLLHGENMHQMNLKKQGFLVIGNESKGISDGVKKLVTNKITIPQAPQSKTESLNAAVATGILLSHFGL